MLPNGIAPWKPPGQSLIPAPIPPPGTVVIETYRQIVAMPCSECAKPIVALDPVACYAVEGKSTYRCISCAFARAHEEAIAMMKEAKP